MLVCPACDGSDLRIELPAVFVWDGTGAPLVKDKLASCEHPIVSDALVECGTCGWMGRAIEMSSKESKP